MLEWFFFKLLPRQLRDRTIPSPCLKPKAIRDLRGSCCFPPAPQIIQKRNWNGSFPFN